MHTKQHIKSRRGSALLLVLMATSITILVLTSYMRTAVSESKAVVYKEANAKAERTAESLANYGAAQVIYHFHQDPIQALQNWTNRELALPDNVYNHITQGKFDIDSLRVSVGPAPNGLQARFFDSSDQSNRNDPLKGRVVMINTFDVYAEATVQVEGRTITRYVALPIQLRDTPFFSNAIFYNMDLELMPETAMSIHGPIHANGDIYFSTNEDLDIYGSVNAAGKIFHGVKLFDGAKYWRSMGPIHIADNTGTLVAMKRDPLESGTEPSHWIDHHNDNASTWLDDASQAWNGLVMDHAFNVPKINLAGYGPYVPDDPATAEDETMNHSYAFIEPVLPTTHANYKGDSVRNEKLAWKAGLILKYDWYNGVTAHKYTLDENGARVFDEDGNALTTEVKLPSGLIGDADYRMDTIERDAHYENYGRVYRKTYKTVQTPDYEKQSNTETRSIADEIAGIESQYDSKVQYYSRFSSSDNVIDASAEAPDAEALAAKWVNDQKNIIYAKDPDGDGFYDHEWDSHVKDENGELIQKTDELGNLVFYNKSVLDVNYDLVTGGFNDYRQYYRYNPYTTRHSGHYGRAIQPLYLDINRLRQLISDQDADYVPEGWAVDYYENEPVPEITPAEIVAELDKYALDFDGSNGYFVPANWTYNSSNWQSWDYQDWQNAENWARSGFFANYSLPYFLQYSAAMNTLYFNEYPDKDANPEAYDAAVAQAQEIAGYEALLNKWNTFNATTRDWRNVYKYYHRQSLSAYDPAEDWNGIVYCEFPTVSRALKADNIVQAQWVSSGLVLINGEDLPTRSDKAEGFSLATNLPMYLVGNYNADGDLTTGSEVEYEPGEVPAMLAADTFTVLSKEFADAETVPETDAERTAFVPTSRRQSVLPINQANSSRTYLYAHEPVEISAGLVAGIAPTIALSEGNTDIQQSGGVHNLIRYMQHWRPDANNPTKMVYRGSMVVLFENEVHTEAIGSSYSHYYQPPARSIGFNNLFREGRFPPGTPKGRTYRKQSLTYPTFEEYYNKTKDILTSNSTTL